MKVLQILTESADELYPEDLDFFETELATDSEYSAEYRAKCREEIKKLRIRMNSHGINECLVEKKNEENEAVSSHISDSLTKTGMKENHLSQEVLGHIDNSLSAAVNMTSAEKIECEIKMLREQKYYKSMFKKYVKDNAEIDADFLEKHFLLFTQWEIDAIVSVKQLGEDFLEKYFATLDHEKIARYQLFSESFFMKHFAEMDAIIVLEHGKNQWRKKENRSRQLDVFLRLKGVKI